MDEYIKKMIDEVKEYNAKISLCLEKIEIYSKAKESCEKENKPFLILDGLQPQQNVEHFKIQNKVKE